MMLNHHLAQPLPLFRSRLFEIMMEPAWSLIVQGSDERGPNCILSGIDLSAP